MHSFARHTQQATFDGTIYFRLLSSYLRWRCLWNPSSQYFLTLLSEWRTQWEIQMSRALPHPRLSQTLLGNQLYTCVFTLNCHSLTSTPLWGFDFYPKSQGSRNPRCLWTRQMCNRQNKKNRNILQCIYAISTSYRHSIWQIDFGRAYRCSRVRRWKVHIRKV